MHAVVLPEAILVAIRVPVGAARRGGGDGGYALEVSRNKEKKEKNASFRWHHVPEYKESVEETSDVHVFRMLRRQSPSSLGLLVLRGTIVNRTSVHTKTYIFPYFFTNNIWSYLLWPPVTVWK